MPELDVAQVLEMPALRSAGPAVVAGANGLSRLVRWVHTTELADIAPLLRGGDLLLSTGIALPDTPAGLEQFAQSLGDSDSAGLVIELGRRWKAIPSALVDACERLDLPLVALSREVQFASVAQAVGERIVDEQIAELREAQRVHSTFTQLSVAEAGPREILEAVQRLAGAAVVLEDDLHRVLDYRSGPGDVQSFVANWQARSREARPEARTGWDETNGWLITRLGRRERGWGRLIVESSTKPPQGLIAVAERAAAALAMHRLHDRRRDSVVRRTHHEIMLELLADPTAPDAIRRCELAGIPMAKRSFIGLSIRSSADPGSNGSPTDEPIATVVRTLHDMRLPALVCEIDRDIRVLVSITPNADDVRIAEEFAGKIVRHHAVRVSAGRAVKKASEIDGTLRESQHVARSVGDVSQKLVHRLEDVHLRGLLTLLGDDERVLMFVDRELERIELHDANHGGGLIDALRALLWHSQSKSKAAASLHLSRPAFYDRVSKIERLLEVNLDDPDIRVSLHVALVAREMATRVN